MKFYKISYFLVFIILLCSCNQLIPRREKHKDDNNLEVSNLKFDENYKTFHTSVELSPAVSSLFLQKDSSVRFEISELCHGNEYIQNIQPKLIEIKNVKAEALQEANLQILALADLTLDPVQLKRQQTILKNLQRFFTPDNLRISFMENKSVTETMPASDYVLDNYIKHVDGEKYFYQSLFKKMKEIISLNDSTHAKISNINVDKHSIYNKNLLIVFSDGKVYNKDNQPIDPNHFTLQREIAGLADSIANTPILYINLKELSQTDESYNDSDNLLKLLCKQSGGKYADFSDEDMILYNLLGLFKEHFADYIFTFENPDYKVYKGSQHLLLVSCVQGDSIIASDNISYYLGSIYNPVIVNGLPTLQVILQGLFLGILTILVIYLVMQFIVPAISYLIFKRKYVTQYKGKNMTFNGKLIEGECYFCKAPFELGDKIVAKCSHVMHKSCWEENEYKCPEYGKNCKHGSHYYNKNKLYDKHNAPFYTWWILAGGLAGLIAWISFTYIAHFNQGSAFIQTIPYIFDLEANSNEAKEFAEKYGSHLVYLPLYGLNISFFLTFALSILTSHGSWLKWKRFVTVFIKAIIGGIFGYLAFLLGGIISIALNFTDNSFLVDWIPWMLSGFIIAFITAFGTDIKLKRALIGAAISVIFGISSMYLWSYSIDSLFDTREFLLLSYMIYCIGFAASIAVTYPRSEKYFLHAEGPIKEMDIALYKWMNAYFLNKHIFIGKSVDCELQMSWDITSEIAPRQAEIKMMHGNIYLIPLEDNGVYINKKPVEANRKIRLYHGSKFTIGKTLFTYLEKDM